MTETINIRPFAGFDTAAFYAILKLRFDVFILEQQSFYPELDDKDQNALHLAAHQGDRLTGVLRILKGNPVLIGRVAVAADARGDGLASRMVEDALAWIAAKWPDRPVQLGAQQHLEGFYARFGFERCSEVYDDGGIPHIDMIKRGSAGEHASG